MEGVDVSLASVRLTQKYIQITTAKQHLFHPVCVFVCVCVVKKAWMNTLSVEKHILSSAEKNHWFSWYVFLVTLQSLQSL